MQNRCDQVWIEDPKPGPRRGGKAHQAVPMICIHGDDDYDVSATTIPTDLLVYMFEFLDITEYIGGASLVCKTWSIDNTFNYQFLKRMVYNSCKHKVKYSLEMGISSQDLIHEFELNTTFAALYTPPYCDPYDPNLYNFKSFPMFHFAKQSSCTFDAMCSQIQRLLFTGSTLCVGYMMQLYHDKFGVFLDEDKCTDCTERFWLSMNVFFHGVYHYHDTHFKNKEQWCIHQIIYNLLEIIVPYSEKLGVDQPCLRWMRNNPNNELNEFIIKTTKLFTSDDPGENPSFKQIALQILRTVFY
eukprot:782855_1